MSRTYDYSQYSGLLVEPLAITLDARLRGEAQPQFRGALNLHQLTPLRTSTPPPARRSHLPQGGQGRIYFTIASNLIEDHGAFGGYT